MNSNYEISNCKVSYSEEHKWDGKCSQPLSCKAFSFIKTFYDRHDHFKLTQKPRTTLQTQTPNQRISFPQKHYSIFLTFHLYPVKSTIWRFLWFILLIKISSSRLIMTIVTSNWTWFEGFQSFGLPDECSKQLLSCMQFSAFIWFWQCRRTWN